jgi:signal transduction histidine kinase
MWVRLAAAPVLLTFGAVLLLFLLYEAAELRWLGDLTELQLYRLQHARVVVVPVVATLLATWLLLRSLPAVLDPPLASNGERRPVSDMEQRRQYARWFIRMRWIAFVVAATFVFIAIEPLRLLPREALVPLLLTTIALGLLNTGYAFVATRAELPERFLEVQAYLDLVLLTLLLHFSGGLENPLTPVMLFHVIIAGAILSRRQCYLVATAGMVLFSGMGVLEWGHAVNHYTLTAFPHHEHNGVVQHAAFYTPFLTSRLLLHTAILYLTAYFATTLAARIRAGESELERYAGRLLTQTHRLEEALVEQQRAQRIAVRAERLAVVGELAGKVAHEVNNPIAVISAKTRLLLADERHAMSERTAGELEKIVDLSDRVAAIAKGLLSYGRPSPAACSPVDVVVPMRHALANARMVAMPSGIAVVDELPGDMPLVHANTGELEQVFLNLFLNALDAMPRGGTLTARVCRQAGAAGAEVACVVQDTGCGIAPEAREQVFEPFFTTKDERGTGLGLSICVGLIRGFGGRIEMDSEVGRGTVMTVVLPVAERGAAA